MSDGVSDGERERERAASNKKRKGSCPQCLKHLSLQTTHLLVTSYRWMRRDKFYSHSLFPQYNGDTGGVCVCLAWDQDSANMAVEVCQLSDRELVGEKDGGEKRKRNEEEEEMKRRGGKTPSFVLR